MPTIKRYNRQVDPTTANLPLLKIPDAVRGAFGEDLERSKGEMARTFGASGELIYKRLEEKADLEEKRHKAQLEIAYQKELQNILSSDEEEEFEHNGEKVKRSKGIFNQQQYQAKGATYRFDDEAIKLREDYMARYGQGKFASDFDLGMQSHLGNLRNKVISHEVKEQKAHRVGTYKSKQELIKQNAYVSGKEGMEDLIAQTLDMQNGINIDNGFSGETAELANQKATLEIVKGAINGALNRDVTGKEATDILDTLDKYKITNEERDLLKKDINKKVSTITSNIKVQEKRTQYVNGSNLLKDLSLGNITLDNEDSIKEMGVKREISQDLTNAVIKTIYNPVDDFDDEGNDEAFIDLVKSILNDTDIDRKNKNLVDVLNGFNSGDIGKKRMQLLVQTAAEMGLEVKNDEANKQSFQRIIEDVSTWAEEAGIDRESGLLLEDAIKAGFTGMKPEEAVEDSIIKEINRQSSSGKKESKLDNDLSKEIQENAGNDDISLNSSEESVYQYFLKSGKTKEEAAQLSGQIFKDEDVNGISSRIRELAPELQRRLPKTIEQVNKLSKFQELMEAVDDFLVPEAGADDGGKPKENKKSKPEDFISKDEHLINKILIKAIIWGGKPAQDLIDVVTGGMSIEDADKHAAETINKVRRVPGNLSALAEEMYKTIRQDIIDTKKFVDNPIKGLKDFFRIDKREELLSKDPIDPRAWEGIDNLAEFAFAPFIKGARALGGLAVPERKGTVLNRVQQMFKDVIKEPHSGVYAERFIQDELTGNETEKELKNKVLIAAAKGTAVEFLTFSQPIQRFIRGLKGVTVASESQIAKAAFKEFEKDIETHRKVAKFMWEKQGLKVTDSMVENAVTPQWVAQQASKNVTYGNYVKGVLNKVAPRFTLNSTRGTKEIPFDKVKPFINGLNDKKMTGESALKALISSGASEQDLVSSGLKGFLEGKETVTKGEINQFVSEAPLIEEARKYDTVEEFVESNITTDLEGSMQHRPTFTRATADNITQEVSEMGLPEDFYENPKFYKTGDNLSDTQSIKELMKVRGKPDEEITIYRASPKKELRVGDWVTLSKNYADGESLQEGTKVYSFKVKAKDIHFAGDSINEFGYYPESRVKQLTEIYNKAHANSQTVIPENIEQSLKPEQTTIGSTSKKGTLETKRNLEKEVEERVKSQGEKIADEDIRKIREENLLGKETIDEIIARKRGIITDKEAVERAKSMRGTINDVLNIPKGTVPNKEQVTAISQIVQEQREINKRIVDLIENGDKGSSAEERELLKSLGKDGLTDQEVLQQALEENTIKLRKAEIVLFAAKSEAGRALQGAKQSIEAVDSRLRIAMGKIKKLPMLDRQAMTEQLANVNLDDNKKFIDFLDNINTSDFFDKFAEWATAIKLYNPTTHLVNFGSNTVRQLIDVGITSTGSPKYAKADAQGFLVGLRQGMKNSLRALTDEGYASQLSKYIEEGGAAPAIGGEIGKWLRTSFRMLGAGDEVFKAIAYQRSLYRQAARMTNNDTKAMKQLLERPTFEMMDEATKIAKRMTFQEDMGEISKAINEFRTPSNFNNPVSKAASLLTRIFVPFLKTPINLAKQAIDLSPLGLVKNQKILKEAIKAGDDETVKRVIGEAIFGSLVVGGVASLALEGKITGGAPRSKKDRDQFYREKKLPYAVNINGTWHQYKRVDPISTIIGITADAITLADEEEFNVGGIIDLVSQNLEDKTFLRGINDLMKITTGEPWEREYALRSAVIGSTIPSFIGHIARSIDPKVRATDNIVDQAQAQIPFLSKGLPPRVNVLGNDIERSNKGLTYFFNPIQSETAEIDPITKELSNLGYSISLPSSYFTRNKVKYELTPEEYYSFSKYVGERLSDKISANLGSRSYERKDIDEKIKIIEKDRSEIMDDWKDSYIEGKEDTSKKRKKTKLIPKKR